MLEYKISPEYEMILIRMYGDISIDGVFDFVKSIVSDSSYDPTYRVTVNNKDLEESAEANKICQSINLAASVVGGFFNKANTKTADACYCQS